MRIDDLKTGIKVYIDREFCKKMNTGDWRRWIIPIMSELLIPSLDKLFVDNKDMLKLAGIVDDNDCIDVDKLYQLFRKASIEQGNVMYSLPVIGNTTFSTTDVDTMYHILKG